MGGGGGGDFPKRLLRCGGDGGGCSRAKIRKKRGKGPLNFGGVIDLLVSSIDCQEGQTKEGTQKKKHPKGPMNLRVS